PSAVLPWALVPSNSLIFFEGSSLKVLTSSCSPRFVVILPSAVKVTVMSRSAASGAFWPPSSNETTVQAPRIFSASFALSSAIACRAPAAIRSPAAINVICVETHQIELPVIMVGNLLSGRAVVGDAAGVAYHRMGKVHHHLRTPTVKTTGLSSRLFSFERNS